MSSNRSRAVVLLCALWGSACGSKSEVAKSPGSASSASSDALWALAPAELSVGMVARDGSLARLHAGIVRLLRSLETAPGGAAPAALVRSALVVEGVNLLDPAVFAGLGIDLERGAALFMSKEVPIAVLPLVDASELRARFDATTLDGLDVYGGGKAFCKTIARRYVCAESPEALATVAKARRPAMGNMVRGDLEMFVGQDLIDGNTDENFRIEDAKGMRASVSIERGGFTARAHLMGKPAGQIANLRSTPSGLVKQLAEESPSGLFLVQASGLWRRERAKAIASAGGQIMPGGVPLGHLLGSMTGDFAIYTLPGSPIRGAAKIGLTDPAPYRKLLAACDQMGTGLPAGISVAEKGNRCIVTIDPRSLAPTVSFGPFSIEMSVASDALVFEFGDDAGAAPPETGLLSFGRDLLTGPWFLAFWGHGALDPGIIPIGADAWKEIRAADPTGGLILWGVLHLNELGFAMQIADDGVHLLGRVRTLWSNPDDLVTEVERRIGAFARGNDGAMRDLSAVAAKHPGSPFARDVVAGPSFLMPVAGLAAIGFQSFKQYTQQAKTTEARTMVASIATAVKSYRAEHGRLPRPSSAMTPPAGSCCAHGGSCAPDAALWSKEPWRSLGISIGHAHSYSYQYEAGKDGKTFHVRATGDLDCDGVLSTFEMKGDSSAPELPEISVQNELE